MKAFRFLGAMAVLVLGIYLAISRLIGVQDKEGKKIYVELCSGCHGENGEGFMDLYPPLANADYLLGMSNDSLVCMIRNGREGSVTVNGKSYSLGMPGFPALSPTQVANLTNYIRQKWAEGEQLSPKKAEALWENCKK